MAESVTRNSFIANVNLLVRNLELLTEVNVKFSREDVIALVKLSTLELNYLIEDLQKGSASSLVILSENINSIIDILSKYDEFKNFAELFEEVKDLTEYMQIIVDNADLLVEIGDSLPKILEIYNRLDVLLALDTVRYTYLPTTTLSRNIGDMTNIPNTTLGDVTLVEDRSIFSDANGTLAVYAGIVNTTTSKLRTITTSFLGSDEPTLLGNVDTYQLLPLTVTYAIGTFGRTPHVDDYARVLKDETHDNHTVEYYITNIVTATGVISWGNPVVIDTSNYQAQSTVANSGQILTGGATQGTFGSPIDPSTLEKVSNKTSTIDDASTDLQYPTAKAVYTLAEEIKETKVEVTAGVDKVYGTDDEGKQTTYDLANLDNKDVVKDVKVNNVSVVVDNEANIDLTGKVDKVKSVKRVYGTDDTGEQTTYPTTAFGSIDDIVGNDGESIVANKVAKVYDSKAIQLIGYSLDREVGKITNVPRNALSEVTPLSVNRTIITDASGSLGVYTGFINEETISIQTRGLSPVNTKPKLLGNVDTRADLPYSLLAAEALFGKAVNVDDYCRIKSDANHAGLTTEIYVLSIVSNTITWGNEIFIDNTEYQTASKPTDAGKILTGGTVPSTWGEAIDPATLVKTTTEADMVYGTDDEGEPTTYPKTSFGAVDDVVVNGASVVTDKVATIKVPVNASEIPYDNTNITTDPLLSEDTQGALDELVAIANSHKTSLLTLIAKVDGTNALYLVGSTLTRVLGGTTEVAKALFAQGTLFKLNKAILTDNQGTLAVYTSDKDTNTMIFTTRTITPIGGDEPTLLGNVATRANLPLTTTAAQTLFGRSVEVDDYCRIIADENNTGHTVEIYITNITGSNITWGNEIILNTANYQAQTTASDSGKVLVGGATGGTFGVPLGFDAIPTTSSGNLVKSGGIESALVSLRNTFLTQTQYDALSTAVKNNGVNYFIYEEV